LDFPPNRRNEGFPWKTLVTEYAVSEILVKRINAVEKTYGQVLEVLGLLRFSFAGVPGVQSYPLKTQG
jgi:hypothetical protein